MRDDVMYVIGVSGQIHNTGKGINHERFSYFCWELKMVYVCVT